MALTAPVDGVPDSGLDSQTARERYAPGAGMNEPFVRPAQNAPAPRTGNAETIAAWNAAPGEITPDIDAIILSGRIISYTNVILMAQR